MVSNAPKKTAQKGLLPPQRGRTDDFPKMERGRMKHKQMNIHRSLTQSWVTSKGSQKLGLGIERTHSKAYFLGKRFQRGTWPTNSKANVGICGRALTPDPRLLLVLLPTIRINCRTRGCAILASRDHSYSVAKIRCCIITQSQNFALPVPSLPF